MRAGVVAADVSLHIAKILMLSIKRLIVPIARPEGQDGAETLVTAVVVDVGVAVDAVDVADAADAEVDLKQKNGTFASEEIMERYFSKGLN